jgi:hypothetical protein
MRFSRSSTYGTRAVWAGAGSITPMGSGGSLPNRTRNGDIAVPRAGAILKASRIWGIASSHSWPPASSSAARSPAFKSRWALSTGFDCGWYAGVTVVLTPSSCPSCVISSPVNWLPLSLWISSGKPNLVKMSFSRWWATTSAVALLSGKASIHLENGSFTVSAITCAPFSSSAVVPRSRWIFAGRGIRSSPSRRCVAAAVAPLP